MTEIVEDILKFKEKVTKRQEAVRRRAAVLVSTAIVNGSPVKTGNFKANWQWGWGVPPGGTTDAVDPSGSATIGAIEAAIAFGPRRSGVVGYLVNNLPQAMRMEYGWSMQAPAGMVRINVARWQAFVSQAAAEAKTEIP